MAKSQRLRFKDVRSVYQFLGECCELGADPLAWRNHVAEHMPELFKRRCGLVR